MTDGKKAEKNVVSDEVNEPNLSAVKTLVQKGRQPVEEGKMPDKEKHSDSDWISGRPIKVSEPVQSFNCTKKSWMQMVYPMNNGKYYLFYGLRHSLDIHRISFDFLIWYIHQKYKVGM